MKNIASASLKFIKMMFGDKLLIKLAKNRDKTVEILDLLFKNMIFKDLVGGSTCSHQTLFNLIEMSISFHFSEKTLVKLSLIANSWTSVSQWES